MTKVVIGLGNPGPRYDATRHNVGWWMADRLAYDWGFGAFERVDHALESRGTAAGHAVLLLKPLTYMNRSGAVLDVLAREADIDPASDMLVVVDDATRAVGGVRFRGKGSPGGHNGLRSISGRLGGDEYARLRIGVGEPPPGVDLADWVLSPFPSEDEEAILALLPMLTEAVEVWISEGVEAAMNRFNR